MTARRSPRAGTEQGTIMAFPLRLARLEKDCPSRGLKASASTVPPSFRLRSAGDLVGLLEQQIIAVGEDEQAGILEKARLIAHLAGVSLKAIEAGNLAARLEALEAALKLRNEGTGSR
jgi:hypothetical protein